ncbi:hypothetical protein F5X99DRAFT_293358 [Biscogniauxia marginata]|nr:hypothetical protein F5X99DRAFT_293358 [Biscogniauxia marginata]
MFPCRSSFFATSILDNRVPRRPLVQPTMPKSSQQGWSRDKGEGSLPPAYSDLSQYSDSESESPPPSYHRVSRSCRMVRGEQTPLLTPVIPRTSSTTSRRLNWTRICGWFMNIGEFALGFLLLALAIFILCSLGYLAFVLLRILLSYFSPTLPASPPTYSVAIIGAGPAGIAAAQQLKFSATAGDIRFNVTLFEAAPRVGGQLSLADSEGGLVFPHGDPFQDPITAEDITGAALLYSNTLFTKDSEAILRDEVEFTELGSQQVKYYSGENSVTETTRPYSKTPTSSWMGLIWRYGAAVWRAGSMTQDGDLRKKITSVPLSSDIKSILQSLGVVDLAQQWATDDLDHRGIGGSYLTEVLEPQVRRTLGQRLQEVSGLAVIMAAAQEDTGNSFAGGDFVERLERIVHAIDVDLRLETKVTGLKHVSIDEHRSAWLVEQGAADTTSPRVEAFDKVIVATYDDRLVRGAMLRAEEAEKDAEAIDAISGLFKPAHITFFTSTKRSEVWGGGDGGAEQILFLDADGKKSYYSGVHEFALVRGITSVREDGGGTQVEYLYRLLSDDDVTEHLRQDPAVTWIRAERIENGYPYLLPVGKFPSFKVPGNSLWWTSVINSVGNTVDLNWLAGKIVAEELIREAVKKS